MTRAKASAFAATLRLLAALLLFALLPAAHAATYTFRSDTYSWESTSNTITSWDRSCTGYQVDDDKVTLSFTGGFTFTFAGTAYTSVRVLSNGMLQFGADAGLHRDYTNGPMPAGAPGSYGAGCANAVPQNVLMGYWMDLKPYSAGNGGGGTVTWQQKGTAPNRYFVVSWNAVYQYNTTTPYTFQIILFENGEFKYQYGNANASGSNATIGVQVSSTDYTQYSYNSGYNANGSAIRWFVASGTPTRIAEYRFDELSWNGSVGEVLDASGNSHNGTAVGSAANIANGYVCRALDVPGNTSPNTVSAVDTALPVASLMGSEGGISFWFRSDVNWTNNTAAMLFDAGTSSSRPFFLQRSGGGALKFSLTDSNGTVFTATSGTQNFSANTWVHVAATWRLNSATNGSVLRLYVNGTQVAVTNGSSSGSLHPSISTLFMGDNHSAGLTPSGGTGNSANGSIDEVRLYNYEMTAVELAADMSISHSCTPPLHHIKLVGDDSGLTCSPTTFTVVACQDAACSSLSTSGVSGTLTATPTGSPSPTVRWPSGSGSFSIPAGSSSTTVQMQLVTPGGVLMDASGVSPSPSSATTCDLSPSSSCQFTAADSGLLFEVPDHVAQVQQTVTVSAVKKADSSNACVPAFANVSKALSFGCAYTDPSSGTKPVVVGGSSVACGASTNVTLSFNASGVASTTVQYGDAGKVTLNASYSGSGSESGLSLQGSAGFVAAPYQFAVSVTTAGPRVAGSVFAATVTAQAYDGSTTPNFGRESVPEGVAKGWVRTLPQGTGAVNGTLGGSVGGFSGGTATLGNLSWSEVGQGDLAVQLAAASGYMGTGYRPAGSTAGAPVWCANENGTCALPSGATATVYYGANGRVAQLAGRSGNVPCSNGVFGDPLVGTVKQCWYVATGGSSNASTGGVGPFRPHHFDVGVTQACGGTGGFTYAGQPFGVTVTALSAANTLTANYDGSANTSPNFAKKVTLSDAPVLGVGSFNGTEVVAAALFNAGVASASPAYGFTGKQTAQQTLVVRATDDDTVSSSGHAEGSTTLRSGRLRLFNAFGSEKSALQMQMQAEYWSGSVWALNNLDSCTALAPSAVALSNVRNHQGGAGTWTTSAGTTGLLSGGRATLTLAAPSGGSTGSIDVALNLGSGAGVDQACTSTHPATTGAAASWLRSQNGSCSAAWDRDPSARASFGLYSPETRKTVHVREIF